MTIREKLTHYKICYDDCPYAFCILEILKEPGTKTVDFEFVYANLSLSKLMNVEPEGLIGSRYSALFPLSDVRKNFDNAASPQKKDVSVIEYDAIRERYLNFRYDRLDDDTLACLISDVTDAQQDKMNLQAALDLFDGGFCILTLDEATRQFTLKSVSDSFCRMANQNRETLLAQYGEDVFGGIHPEEQQRARALYFSSAKDGACFSDVYRISFDKRHFRTIAVNGIVRKLGKQLCYYINYTDITNQRNMRELLEKAVEGNDLSIWEWDIPNRIAYQSIHSSRCRASSANTYQDFPQCLFDTKHYHPDDESIARQTFDRVLSGEKRVNAVLRTYDPIRKEYWWEEICYTTELDRAGRPVRTVATGRDITEKMEAIRSVQNERLRYQALIQNIPGGVAIYRVSDRFETVYFSDGVPALTGYTTAEYQELIKEDAAKMIYPADAEMVVRELRLAIQNNTIADFDFRKSHRDGSIVWVHLQGRTIGEDNGAPLLQCIFHNITRQKKIEMDLLEKETMSSIALRNTNINLWSYDIQTHTLYQTKRSAEAHPGFEAVIPDFVETTIRMGYIKEESISDFRELYRLVEAGEREVSKDIWFWKEDGSGWWCERIIYTNLLDSDGNVLRTVGVGRNITEETQTAVRKQQMELALASTSVSLWTYDIRYGIFESYHYNASEVVLERKQGGGYRAILAGGYVMPESVDDFIALHQALERGEKSAAAVIHYDKSKISMEWQRITYSVVFDADDNPLLGVAIGEDVTELIHSKKRFNDEMRYLEAVQSDNLLAKVRSNLTQNWVESYVAKPGVGISHEGMSYDQSAEALVLTAFTPEQQESMRRMLDRDRVLLAFENGDRHDSLDYQRKVWDGRVIWVNISVKTYQDPETGDIKSFMYSYDIDNEKTMKIIVDKIVDIGYEMLALISPKTGMLRCVRDSVYENRMSLRVNEPYVEVMNGFVERYIGEEKEEAHAAFRIENIQRKLEKAAIYNFSFTLLDGQIRYRKKWQFAYLDESHSAIILIRSDISQLFEQQEQQREVLRNALAMAQQASTAKSDFLSRMSHEIRTPMNAIIGMSTLAAQCVQNPEQVTDCISKVGLSARYLLSLINDILDMSRIESGKLSVRKEEILFEKFLKGINTIAYELAAEKGVGYDCILTSFTEDVYLGDPMKLQQILINLITNAVKFTPKGGKVQFMVHQSRIEGGKAYLRFTVNDTGVGIKEAFLQKLFEPFEQEYVGNTTPYGGTGLGLAISKNLVTMLGGTISVNSIVGVGSEFTVDVALELCEEAKLHTKIKTQMNWSQLSALIVDDEITICEHTKHILSEMGTKAEWVDSGYRAVELVQKKWDHQEFFDLILVDWKMPEMDGIETARRIRQIAGPEVTILIMTAYDWVAIEAQAKQAGVNLLISKPLFKSSLCSAFETVYHRKAQEKQKPVEAAYHFTGKRILLVEDHLLNIEVAKRLLTSKGIEVEVAENGLVAIEAFATAPARYFDAILMDIRMPVMDGLTAAKSIRQMRKETAKTIPIVAMSANAFDEDVEKSKAAGINTHLAKPIEPQILFRTLEEIFESSEASAI